MNDCFSWNICFPVFEFQVKHWLFMGLEPADLGLELMPSAPLDLWLAIWNMSTSTLCVYIIFITVSKCSSYKWNDTAIELAAAENKLFKGQTQDSWNLDLSLEVQYCTILYLIKRIKHIFMMFEFEWDFRLSVYHIFESLVLQKFFKYLYIKGCSYFRGMKSLGLGVLQV